MDKLNKNKNACLPVRQGFSLIELVIVMAIISIMTAVGLVSLQSNKVTIQLEAAGREVAAAIREAQNNALNGKNASSTGTICKEYYFNYTVNSTSYSVTCTGGSYPVSYNLKTPITFSTGGSINFSIPSGNVSAAANIKLTKGGSNCYYVRINQSGSISEQPGAC